MEKEPLHKSGRAKLGAGGIILEVLILFAPQLGLEVSQELLQAVAVSIAGLVGMLIHARTQRNTS